jgi:chromosome segregation ATPase
VYLKINEEIRNAKEKVKEKEHIEQRIKDLKELLDSYEKELVELKAKLAKEELDVKRLEGITLSNLLAVILHNKEEKIDKEKKEYIEIKLKFDHCNQKVSDVREDLDKLRKELDRVGNANIQYKKLMKEKEEELKSIGSEASKEKLRGLEALRLDLCTSIKELREAVLAGENLLACIDDAQDSLSSAKNWGTLDMFSDSIIVSMEKYEKVDDTQVKLNKIPYLVDKFKKELADVTKSFETISNKIEFSLITKTVDIFFDNIFTDMSVLARIEESYDEIRPLARYVDECIIDLKKQKERLEDEVINIDFDINQFIELEV